MRERIKNIKMHSYPGMVAMITTRFLNEKNIMAAGWHSYISMEPPLYGVAIGQTRYTNQLIEKAGCFAINFLKGEDITTIQLSGIYSGNKINKFKELSLSYDEGHFAQLPILDNAYMAYECEVYDKQSYGDHDWVVGEIKACYRDESLFLDNGLPNFNKLNIPLYLGRSQYYITNDKGILRAVNVKEDE